tara:strand:- start:212747 stop:213532 length:786 start_codon:yes stop_codon:yes gene_type:complete
MIKRILKTATLITLFFALHSANCYAKEITWKTVDHIIDGDTFVTKDGSHVRLLGINTPEIGRGGKENQPFANEARLKLNTLLFNKRVRLEFGERYKDRYNRLLAHVYMEDGTWINRELIALSLAHVYSFPDNRAHTNTLIELENNVKLKKQGIWGLERWKTYKTDEEIPDSAIGKFNITEGTVHHTTNTKGKIYINFGSNWREDFTVEIRKKELDIFKQSGIDPSENYNGKKLQIRGVFKPVNGVLVTATHPEQLTILSNF